MEKKCCEKCTHPQFNLNCLKVYNCPCHTQPTPNNMEKECPMKGRMCQCSSKEKCFHQSTYKGKRLEDMTKEELIEAVGNLGNLYSDLLKTVCQ